MLKGANQNIKKRRLKRHSDWMGSERSLQGRLCETCKSRQRLSTILLQ